MRTQYNVIRMFNVIFAILVIIAVAMAAGIMK